MKPAVGTVAHPNASRASGALPGRARHPRQRAVFLDRDGVVIERVTKWGPTGSPRTVGEMRLRLGVAEACHQLRGVGFKLVMVTNQPDVARGQLASADLEQMHRTLAALLPLDDILACIHDDVDRCGCRKPEPGMLLTAAARFNLSLRESFMVGDRWRDVEAGRRAGCRTVFVSYGDEGQLPAAPDHVTDGLPGAAAWILGNSKEQ